MYKFWLKILTGLLIGYMTFDRGFAHFGVSPIYVGELLLVPGVLMALVPGAISPALKTPLGFLYVVFAIFSLCCSVPYVGRYGADTLRDSAIWVYGLFFLIVASLLIRRPQILMRAPRVYGRWMFWYTPLLCVLLCLRFLLHAGDENEGGTRFFSIKLGDLGAHLAGVFAFLLLSLDLLWQSADSRPRASIRYVVTAAGGFVALVFVSSVNRGGMLSVVVAVGVVALLARQVSWKRWGVILASALVAVLLVFGAAGAKLRISNGRTLSLDQLETNLSSVIHPGNSANVSASQTARWRLLWWTKIIDYTFFGPHFWTGKGYGVNLADSDGFQVGSGGLLRAPHNSSMTILARSGVPGFGLWLAILTTFSYQMIRLVLHARQRRRSVWSRIALWCYVYWLAMVVDSCFDVALEGPQLGIWFWCLMGFGVALQTIYKDTFALEDQHMRATAVQYVDHRNRLGPTSPSAVAADLQL